MVSSRSIRSLSSRRFDSRCSSLQSSGIGVIAKNAFWPLSSGPGELSIAPPKARRKIGVHWISSGSSARPIRSFSAQNASIRAFSARQKSSRSSAFGCSARWHRGRHGRGCPRRPGPAGRRTTSATVRGRGGPSRHGRRSYSRSAAGHDPFRRQRLRAHRVPHLGRERVAPETALALAGGEDHVAQVGLEGGDRAAGGVRRGDQARLDRGHSGIGRGGPLGGGQRVADELADPRQLLQRGLGLEPPDRTAGRDRRASRERHRARPAAPSRRPAVDARRSANGANSRALSVNRPSPMR